MKSITLTLHNQGEIYTHPIGYKLIEPNGITLYYRHGTLTLPLSEVTMTVEVDNGDTARSD